VKPSHFFADTEYSIGTSDFRFSFASLLLSFVFQNTGDEKWTQCTNST